MQKVLNIYKKEGETPLEAIKRFKRHNKEYSKEKMTYAGRLDPMATGVLPILVGDECKEKQKYLDLDKVYEFEILWGFSTDSFDVLGMIEKSKKYDPILDVNLKLETYLKEFVGNLTQKYPAFSGKTIKGKKIFQKAKDRELTEEEIPKRDVRVYDLEILDSFLITPDKILNDIQRRVILVSGDFRQGSVLRSWRSVLKKPKQDKFLVTKILCSCSSGTYIRTIANDLGKRLQVPALAYKIHRTSVGEYNTDNKDF